MGEQPYGCPLHLAKLASVRGPPPDKCLQMAGQKGGWYLFQHAFDACRLGYVVSSAGDGPLTLLTLRVHDANTALRGHVDG